MPFLRLVLFALPFVVAWAVSPIGLPISIAQIGAGEASVVDWAKLGVLAVFGIVVAVMPKKRG